MYISIPLTILAIFAVIIFWRPISSFKKATAEAANMIVASATDHARLFRAEDTVDLKRDAANLVKKYNELNEDTRNKSLNDILATIK